MTSTTMKPRSLIETDLAEIDHFMIETLASDIPLIQEMVRYILSAGGKRIRPIIALLAAKTLDYTDIERIHLAATIELIHTATLLHDDVVDGTTLRRGQETANHIWNNKSSILVGDFLYSRAFQLVVNLKNNIILDHFAKATHYIAEGEILQLSNCFNPETTEAFYFDVIRRKTAKLFELAAFLPSVLATPNEDQQNALRDYGTHLGLAYQLVDDALDYSSTTEDIGKNACQDLSEGKTTLPMIYAIQQSSGVEKDLLCSAIKNGSSESLEDILKVIESKDATGYTLRAARRHGELAKHAISILPASLYREGLEELCDFVVERTY